MQTPLIISYYTDTWEYKSHSIRLAKECDKLNLKHYIKEFKDSGSWIDNTRLKSKFILDSLEKFKQPVLWVDVDASIHKIPTETISQNVDFMGVHQLIGPKRTWHVGVMYFAYNDKTIQLLQKWVDYCTSGTDEAAFENVWLKYNESIGLTSKELPNTYYMIDEVKYNMHEQPVISHRLSKCPSKIKSKK